ncbi:MAG: dethiobiotin synthase [Acidobacteria bacterium]|nr:dethiobiotin synthase [Acidobacteriota bacterium]
MSLVVVGTGTEVGKTITCAVLLSRYAGTSRLAYWKPIATGSAQDRDTLVIKRLCAPQVDILQEFYLFEPPVSPHLAARLARKRIRPEKILEALWTYQRQHSGRPLIIEGIGGLLVPLTAAGHLLADLLKEMSLPCLLVASSTLGTINHTLLTIEAMRSRDLNFVGVVLNGPRNRENRLAIQKFGQARIISEIEPMQALSQESVARAARGFDRRALLKSYLT